MTTGCIRILRRGIKRATKHSSIGTVASALLTFGAAMELTAQPITAAGQPAELNIRPAGDASIRVTLKPLTYADDLPFSPGVAKRPYAKPVISLRTLSGTLTRTVGALSVEIKSNPLTITATNARGQRVQQLIVEADGRLSFDIGESPVLGMGEGGPKPTPGTPWRTAPIQFDRRGRFDTMEPRWQSDAYGSRNPVATLIGTNGWALFVATPWVQVDMLRSDRGYFISWKPTAADNVPQNERNQQQTASKGLPPVDKIVPGLIDVFVFDAHNPLQFTRDYSRVTGPAVLPPRWALGYMQSHRTIEDETQILGVINTFREKRIPIDAVIYLGTGFSPRGWNTTQPSFAFNPDVFKRDPKVVLADMHAKNVHVVVHMVPWDRDKLPTLHGTIPAASSETLDVSHIQNYWQQHVDLTKAGVDAFWPDEGDWFNLFERIKRHEMYYEGPLSTNPNVRPWSLHRNGYPGIAQWGGWVWSGDTESSWKTLEGQIAVGINYSLSIAPFWGSDIGGFYQNSELTGELYARWFQFASFTGSFRSHGRTWWTRLPWGWGLSDMGPRENDNKNTPTTNPNDPRNILQSEMNNPAIEPIARRFSELRYQLMPYTYTLAWEARTTGMPLMRAMWLQYPNDVRARGNGSEYMWGANLLIAPVFEKGAKTRTLYLPAGDWYDWWTNEKIIGGKDVTRATDLATMPILVRAGAIVPVDPIRQYTSEPVQEPTTLRVYPGANGAFTLYDDDGISQEYLSGRSTQTQLRWNDGARQLTIAPANNASASINRELIVQLMPAGPVKRVRYTGAQLRVGMK
ncbi:MAG: TIM-barrel domain-containing protein [Gemmatimonas sp.]